jgi:hypothetical protein
MDWISKLLGRNASATEDQKLAEYSPLNPDAPVSSALLALVNGEISESEFFSAFLSSEEIGIDVNFNISGVKDGDQVNSSDHHITVKRVPDQQGNPVMLAFADPKVFEENYGDEFRTKFNQQIRATVSVADAIRSALSPPDSHGIRLTSAIGEHSIVIPRPILEAMQNYLTSSSQ